MRKILLSILLIVCLAAPAHSFVGMYQGKQLLYSGTITGLRISSVDGTAFLDNCAVEVPEAQWVLKTSGNIAAGDNKLDYTSANAFVEFGVDLSAYQDGNHKIYVTDSAGKVAQGFISGTAPGGLTFSGEIGE